MTPLECELMTGRQIAKAYAHFLAPFFPKDWRDALRGSPWPSLIASVERDYGIRPHELVPPDVATTVLRHLRYSFWQCRKANRQAMTNYLSTLSQGESE